MLWLAAALSVVMGIVLGLLGGGGSILTVPILLYVAGLPPKQAIATSLLVVGVTSLSGLARHHQLGNVRWRVGLSFGGVAMVGAYVGGRLGAHVPGAVLLVLFAALMVVSAVGMLRPKKVPREASAKKRHPALWSLALSGLSVGLLTGLVGAGGGFIIVPALVFLAGLSMREAIGTSLLIIAMNSSAGVAGQLGHVDISLGTASIMTAAAVLGSFAGVAFSERISPTILRRIFGYLVLVMAGYILFRQAPTSLLTWLGVGGHLAYVLLGAVAVGASTLWARHRRERPQADAHASAAIGH